MINTQESAPMAQRMVIVLFAYLARYTGRRTVALWTDAKAFAWKKFRITVSLNGPRNP
jgi:hypothetical protein